MKKDTSGQRNATPRGNRPYDVSHSFVRKVASRVSGLFGGLFSTPDREETETVESRLSLPDDELSDSRPSINHSINPVVSPAQYEAFRNHLSLNRSAEPVAGTSGLQQSFGKINSRNLDGNSSISSPGPSGIKNRLSESTGRSQPSVDETILRPGPSGLTKHSYGKEEERLVSASRGSKFPRYEPVDTKINTGDDHSESSESTSGCSSLVPQADRLSQSALAASARRKSLALDEKLQYARQLKQSRSSLYLNRSIPIHAESPRPSRTPSFDISAYGKPILNHSVRENMLSSPFYTGQTTYGGAAARRSSFAIQPSPRNMGSQIAVKPASEEREGANMSQTARRILAALEELSTPLNDAKRIPTPTPPLAAKRRYVEAHSSGSVPKRPALDVPTVADLLKLRRLEEIQDSTTMARQVTVATREPSPPRWSGKIVTKKKDRGKPIEDPPPPPPELPKVPLQFTSLPNFDFCTPVKETPVAPAPAPVVAPASPGFKFSTPSAMPGDWKLKPARTVMEYTFSSPTPLSEWQQPKPLTSVMTSVALAKLKRKSVDNNQETVTPAKVLSTGSVMDFLSKSTHVEKSSASNNGPKAPTGFGDQFKPAAGSWSCSACMIDNSATTDKCVACENPKIKPVKSAVETQSSAPSGFGDKFKPVAGSWACKSCMVNNKDDATKCIACETPAPSQKSVGFGDKFKPVSGSWTCDTCMVSNAASVTKCVACETAKPGSTTSNGPETKPPGPWTCSVCLVTNKQSLSKCAACESPQPNGPLSSGAKPIFNFGLPSSNCTFKFGIDKADAVESVVNGPKNETTPMPPLAVKTSTATFSFGIPATTETMKKQSVSVSAETDTTVPKSTELKIPTSSIATVPDVTKPAAPFSFGIVATSAETSVSPPKPAFTVSPSQPFKLNGPAVSDAEIKINPFTTPFPANNSSTPSASFNPAPIAAEKQPFSFGSVKPSPSTVFKFGNKTDDGNTSGVFRFGAATNAPSQPSEVTSFSGPRCLFPVPENRLAPNVTAAPMFSFGKPATPEPEPRKSMPFMASTPFSFSAPSATPTFNAPIAGFGTATSTMNTPFAAPSAPRAFGAGIAPNFGASTATIAPAFGGGTNNPFGTTGAPRFGLPATSVTPFATLTSTSTPNFSIPAHQPFGQGSAPPAFAPASASTPFQFNAGSASQSTAPAGPSGNLTMPPSFQFNIGQAPQDPRRPMIRAKRRSQQK